MFRSNKAINDIEVLGSSIEYVKIVMYLTIASSIGLTSFSFGRPN